MEGVAQPAMKQAIDMEKTSLVRFILQVLGLVSVPSRARRDLDRAERIHRI